MLLEDLSNAQLVRVFNKVTGQTVAKFTSKESGQKRLRKALEVTNTDFADALELSGLAQSTEPATVREAIEQLDAAEPQSAAPNGDIAAHAVADADGPQKEFKRDKYGFIRRKAGTTKRRAKAEKKVGRKEEVLAILRHGATVAEIMKVTGWLPHTTRAFLSKGGALAKAGINVSSERVTQEDGSKVTYYRVGA